MADLVAIGPSPGTQARNAGRLLDPPVMLASAIAALVIAALAAAGIGAVPMGISDIVAAVTVMAGADNAQVPAHHVAVLGAIRFPRVLLAMTVGAALALSGAVLQGLFRNPLADPGVIGVSGGAALGAGIAIVLGSSVLAPLAQVLGLGFVPAAAFAGALVISVIVFRSANIDGRASLTVVLLVGIAMNALASAGMGFLSFVSTDEQLRNLTFWTLGSVGGATWARLAMVAALVVPAAVLMLRLAPALDALALGESSAAHLGVDVPRLKTHGILACALAVGASVAATGIIGFIGLVAPHLVRLACGPGHRLLLPASALVGATLLTLADLLARTVASPAELPVGIVTAFLGVPVFIALLAKQRNAWA